MKKNIITTVILLLLAACYLQAQNDTIYIMKGGALIFKYNVSEIDSMIFYPPQYAAGTVTDIDGNTYQTIIFGTQVWMAENLRTTKYKNGTAITLITDNTEWAGLTGAGFCWYNNDMSTYGETYGALYNWFTVNTGNLCPDGWHVATDNDWKTLEMLLGMSQTEADNAGWRGTNEGARLAGSAALWNDGALEASSFFGNSGFNALPAPSRSDAGVFGAIGSNSLWWTSTEGSTDYAYSRGLSYSLTTVYRLARLKKCGFSVRCVKN